MMEETPSHILPRSLLCNQTWIRSTEHPSIICYLIQICLSGSKGYKEYSDYHCNECSPILLISSLGVFRQFLMLGSLLRESRPPCVTEMMYEVGAGGVFFFGCVAASGPNGDPLPVTRVAPQRTLSATRLLPVQCVTRKHASHITPWNISPSNGSNFNPVFVQVWFSAPNHRSAKVSQRALGHITRWVTNISW